VGAAHDEAPYKAPPNAPVLYIKTANTFTPQRAGHRACPRV
jgi:5-oxopent-3-ene-1,2,5-tricarboxylate decarboxylase / 2-hydroxyhepta-2,4-diene-1,7-dioate isomerase